MLSDSFESPIDSDTDYKTNVTSQENMSPLQILLNYKGSSSEDKELKDTQNNSDSFESLSSGDQSPNSIIKESLLKNQHKLKLEPINGTSFTPRKNEVMDKTYPDPNNLSYSFNNTCYVFRIFFEPKLSTVKETTFIPSRIIINKSPFIIGSDSSCDLVLSKKKFKFIASRHCKITYHTYFNSPTHSSSPLNSSNFQSPSNSQSYLNSPDFQNINNNNNGNNTNNNNDTQYVFDTENMQNTQKSFSPNNTQKSFNSQNTQKSPTSTGSVYHSPSDNYFNASDKEQDDITSYRVKIVKSSPSGTTYVNNSLLRGNLFLENGDLISLGPRNNYLTFRVVFRTKKECQLLRNQLSNTNSDAFNSTHSYYQTEDELNSKDSFNMSSREDDVTTEDERIVLPDDIDITGVKIFLFQVFNYSTKYNHSVKSNQTQEDSDSSEKEYLGNEDNKNRNKEKEDKDNNNNKDNKEQEKENKNQKELSQDSEYYKLRSPIRNFYPLSPMKSPSDIKSSQELYIKSLESNKSDPFMEVYSSSERILNSFSISETQGSNSQTIQEENEEDEEYMDKVKFLKSITPTNFPVVIDTNRSSLSGSTTPTGGKTHYKLIGVMDACNNMNISELLPIIDEQVRNNIDSNLKSFQVVLKKFNLPVDREMLDNSWVFQLEFLDTDNPKIRRAIYKNDIFKEGKEKLERVLKDNKCRVMYIKTD